MSPAVAPRAALLASTGFVALLVGAATGRPALVVLAGVTLMPLLLVPTAPAVTQASVTCERLPGQIVEGDPVVLTVTVRLDRVAEQLTVTVAGNGTLDIEPESRRFSAPDADVLEIAVTVTPTRWGRADPPLLTITTTSRAGLRAAAARLFVPTALVALPRPASVDASTVRFVGRARAGNHVTARAGDGVEFAGVREYRPGDALRRVHWPVSSRRGQLYVTERAAEAAMDVVVVIDTLGESGPRGASTLDASLRGAAGVSRALLRNGDRVGLVLLGGSVSWLAPASSARTWYRLMAAALNVAVSDSYLTPDVDRIPRVALPPGAVVLLFTPLLDDRALAVCSDLRRRRFTTIVLDVLARPEPSGRHDENSRLGQRLWRLKRLTTEAQLSAMGCVVTRWDAREPLDVPLATAMRRARRQSVPGPRR